MKTINFFSEERYVRGQVISIATKQGADRYCVVTSRIYPKGIANEYQLLFIEHIKGVRRNK